MLSGLSAIKTDQRIYDEMKAKIQKHKKKDEDNSTPKGRKEPPQSIRPKELRPQQSKSPTE